MSDELLDSLDLAVGRGQVHGGAVLRVEQVDVQALLLDQVPNDVGVDVQRREVQRRPLLWTRGVGYRRESAGPQEGLFSRTEAAQDLRCELE